MRHEAELRVEWGWRDSTSTSDERALHIAIRDDLSSQAVVDFTLSEHEFCRLLTGTVLKVDGWLVPEELRDRLGRRMVNESVDVPRDLTRGVSANRRGEAPEVVHSWARARQAAAGWDDYDEPRLTNRGGWAVTFRRWVDPEEVKA